MNVAVLISRYMKDHGLLPGLRSERNGGLAWEITEDEKSGIDIAFDMLKGYLVHPEAYDEIQKAIQAQGLWNYAAGQIAIHNDQVNPSSHVESLRKALAAVVKAYVLYPLPIFLYDIGAFLEMLHIDPEAVEAFRLFVDEQSHYTPNHIAKCILVRRDVAAAVNDARARVRLQARRD